MLLEFNKNFLSQKTILPFKCVFTFSPEVVHMGFEM